MIESVLSAAVGESWKGRAVGEKKIELIDFDLNVYDYFCFRSGMRLSDNVRTFFHIVTAIVVVVAHLTALVE